MNGTYLSHLKSILERKRKLRYYCMIFSDYRQKDVRLTEERLDHIYGHPEMKNQLSKIKVTLADPDEVRKSDKNDSVHLYFKKFKDTPVTEKYLMAVVRAEAENPFLVTSFFTNTIRSGKTPQLYTKSD